MIFFYTAIIIALLLVKFLVYLDIILSFLSLVNIHIRFQIISDTIDPFYFYIKKIIPTRFGPLEFAPLIIIISVELIVGFIYKISPDTLVQILKLQSIF